MNDPDWINLSEVPSIADERWLYNGGPEAPLQAELLFAPAREFAAKPEPSAAPLLGSAEDTLLPADGALLMYGDGGAGKTTLTLDACSRLAAGQPWLGAECPAPLRITLIENEGPRGKFRQKLAAKLAHSFYSGESGEWGSRMWVLEEPWTQFSLRQPSHQAALAAHISASESDICVMGPLATLGAVGGGTPEEVSAFERLLAACRSLASRAFAWWIVHHENKAGDVSGAWERVPDTLLHVQAQGNGHTRIHWRKARWASAWHGISQDLEWAEGKSYEVRAEEEIDYHAELLAAFAEADEWRTATEASKLIGRRQEATRDALSDLVERGEMIFEKGPPGRHGNTLCWRLAEPPVSSPRQRENTGEETDLRDTDWFSSPAPLPYGERGGAEKKNQPPVSSPERSGKEKKEELPDDGIPF